MAKAGQQFKNAEKHRRARQHRDPVAPMPKEILAQVRKSPRGLTPESPDPWDSIDVNAFIKDAKKVK